MVLTYFVIADQDNALIADQGNALKISLKSKLTPGIKPLVKGIPTIQVASIAELYSIFVLSDLHTLMYSDMRNKLNW